MITLIIFTTFLCIKIDRSYTDLFFIVDNQYLLATFIPKNNVGLPVVNTF